MVYVSDKPGLTPKRFISERITRIAPPYWVMTTFLLIAGIAAPSLFNSVKVTPQIYIASMTFFPWPNPTVPGDPPLIGVGWTLNYEMFFYTIFAISMAISRKFRIEITTGVILLCLSLRFLPLPVNVWTTFLEFPVMLEFCFGMYIARLANAPRLPVAMITGLLLVGIAWLVVNLGEPLGHTSPSRMWLWGIPAAVIVFSIVRLETMKLVPKNNFLLHLGNASYALYLTHIFTLGVFRAAWSHLGVHRPNDVVLLVAQTVTAISVALVFHYYVEKPMTHFLRKKMGLSG